MAFELHNRQSKSVSYQQLDESAGNGHPVPPRPKPNLLRRWLWESLAAFVALGCMGAVIVILCLMQDKREDRWTFYFRLTSTVAGFITAVKSLSLLIVGASLSQRKWSHFEQQPSRLGDFDVFDEASRGPLGAIHLLWRLRTRWSFAVLGAIITIASISVDSFVQQVIDTEVRDVLHDGNGNETSFWVAESYITGAGYRPGLGDLSDPQPSTVDPAMQGAIYRGIYGIESSAPFGCPSQCKWEESYTTLGVESKCEDVTLRAFDKAERIPDTKGSPSGIVRLHTPGGLVLTYDVSFTAYSTAINVVAKPTYRNPESASYQVASYEPDFVRIGIFRLKSTARAEARRNNGIALDQLNTDHAEVYECQLGFKAFQYSDIGAGGNKITIGSRVVRPLVPGVYKEEMVIFSTPGLPTFRVSVFDLAALGAFLNSSSFSGTMYDGESGPQNETWSPGIGLALLDVDVNQTFVNTALSMTHQLQSGEASNVVAKTGKNVEAKKFVVVRWGFLAVPIVVVGAAVLFLGVTMWRTRRDTLWKSSAVAVLYHAIVPSQNASEAVLRSGLRDEKELESSAKKIQVRYER